MTNVSIEIEKKQAEEYRTAAEAAALPVQFFEIKRFDGGTAIVAAVPPLLTVTLPFITKIILEQIRSRRHIVVKVDGVELRGLDNNSAAKILAQALEARKQ